VEAVGLINSPFTMNRSVSETDQIVGALKAMGIAFNYVLFDDEGHGIVKLKNRIRAYNEIVKFLDKHLT